MDTKLFARIGAGTFVTMAIALSLAQLRESPAAPPAEVITVDEADGDPLPAQLRACAAMGETALSSLECRAAWGEKRRRFLGVEARAHQPREGAQPIASGPPQAEGL